jgi:hypothetical protein
VVVSSESHTDTTVRYTQVGEMKESRRSGLWAVAVGVGVLCLVTIPFLVSVGSSIK